MTTIDILLPSDNSWIGIPFTSSQTIIFNQSGQDCFLRYGNSSTNGIRIENNQTVIVDETVQVRASNTSMAHFNGFITVTR